jgi:hypothetical protein
MTEVLLAVVLSFLPIAPAYADEPSVPLIDAPGRDAVEGNCAACHSLDRSEEHTSELQSLS